jgi:hypothetical protein
VTRKPQAEPQRAIRDRRIFYRWLWLVYAPLVLGFLALLVFASGAMPGFLTLPFLALLALNAISIRLVVERRRRKIALRVPPTLLIGVGATVVAVLAGAFLAWMGIDRLSTATGPPLLVTGGFLMLAAAFAPGFKLLDLAMRVTARALLRISGDRSPGPSPPARPRPQPRPRKAA